MNRTRCVMMNKPSQIILCSSLVGVAVLFTGCLLPLTAPSVQAVSLPGEKTFRKGALIFHSDAEVSENHPLFLELASFPEEVCRVLELPVTDKPIHIYLFKDRLAFETYIHVEFKDIPSRRALFVKRPGTTLQRQETLQVLAFWGDRVQDDLRHELTHATLNGVLQELPLWLDEGLAMYFEVGVAAQGKHQRVLNALEPALNEGSWKCDLQRLEGLKDVSQMGLADYQEVWAWVHYLMHSSPLKRSALLAYLKERRKAGTAPGFTELRQEEVQLRLHLKQLLTERGSWPHG